MSEVRICSWVDLSLTDVERLLDASHSTESLQQVLSEILGDPAHGSKQDLIELDLYTYAVHFAKNKGFSAEQLSAFYTILKSVHLMCISTPFDNFQETFQYFKQLLLRHSVNRPPYSTSLYSIAQVRDISEYVLKTYFKHFKLYKYAFTKRVRLTMKMSYSGIPETPEPSQTDILTETVCVEGEGEETREEPEVEKGMEHCLVIHLVRLFVNAEVIHSCLNL